MISILRRAFCIGSRKLGLFYQRRMPLSEKTSVPVCRNCGKRSTGAFSSVTDLLQQWERKSEFLRTREKREDGDIETFRETIEKLLSMRSRPSGLETAASSESANFEADWEPQISEGLQRSRGAAGSFRKTAVEPATRNAASQSICRTCRRSSTRSYYGSARALRQQTGERSCRRTSSRS